jgi:hypothetical protein
VAGAGEVRPAREHAGDLDLAGLAAQRLEPRRHLVQAVGEGFQDVAGRLAEAQRVEVVDRARAVDVEEEAARVQRVAAAVGQLLQHGHPRARIMGRDRGVRARGVEAEDGDVAHGWRNGSFPSHPTAASRSIA